MYFDANEFGIRVAALRKLYGMTQEELAEKLGMSWDHLSKLERGKRSPSIDLLIAMACTFHVSTDYLLLGQDMDQVMNRSRILDIVAQLTEIAKTL